MAGDDSPLQGVGRYTGRAAEGRARKWSRALGARITIPITIWVLGWATRP